MVCGPGDSNCKIYKCFTLITKIHKLKKKLQKRFEHKNGQKDIEQQLAKEKNIKHGNRCRFRHGSM